MYSVIIPTLNAEGHIHRLLSGLNSQTVPLDIIVIDSTSSDRTIEIASACGAGIIKVRQEDFDHGGTRNRAARHARGEILVFLTQDILPADKLSIGHLVSPLLQDERIGACYGRQLPHPEASLFASHLRLFNYPEEPHVYELKDRQKHGIKTAFLSNSFAAYRKTALEKIGWFREKMIFGEDSCAAARMLLSGFKVAYAADAKVYHSHDYTSLQEFRRYFDVGVFHRLEPWLIQEFGKAEGEGKRFIESGLSFLRKKGEYLLIPEFVFRNLLKYLGYKLGRNYDKLPDGIVKQLSMNRCFWNS